MSDRLETTIDTVDGDRGMPSVNARQPTSVKKGLALIFLVGILALGLGAVYFWFVRGRQAEATKPIGNAEQVQSSVPARLFGAAPPPPPEAPQEASPIPLTDERSTAAAPPAGRAGTPPPTPRLDKSAADLMVAAAAARGAITGPAEAATAAAAMPGLTGGDHDAGPLNSLLTGSATTQSGAGMIGDRNFMLAKAPSSIASCRPASTAACRA